jgi:hypothetical protein
MMKTSVIVRATIVSLFFAERLTVPYLEKLIVVDHSITL